MTRVARGAVLVSLALLLTALGAPSMLIGSAQWM